MIVLVSQSLAWTVSAQESAPSSSEADRDAASVATAFKERVQPLLKTYCVRCHNADEMKSGIRVDQLSGDLEERHLRLWEGIQHQIADEVMPPEDEPQPTTNERKLLVEWIERGLNVARSRKTERNGSIRRLTVSQYRNTLRDLLGLEDNLADVLPPDALSKDGFTNNSQSMRLSPLQVEAYFNIAEKALDIAIVDESSKPKIQNFRMDLGTAINNEPCPDNLILGANNHLLQNKDFMVTQLSLAKPFDYEPFFMRTKYRFIEGYEGNSTVRGWREYDSIYHSVFACMRGNEGYPKGRAYQTIPEGLLLRPAIPSAELFGVESTYGPKANFKISLRELPNHGRFRITVNAAKYDDGLLLDQGTEAQIEPTEGAITVTNLAASQMIEIEKAGVYQIDAHLRLTPEDSIPPDASKLHEGLIASWPLDGDARSQSEENGFVGELVGGAKFTKSPFGEALSVDGTSGAVVVPRNNAMNVADGDFTIAAWIHPRELRQAGIVCLGGYGYTHGWLFDMPNGNGVIRLETAKQGGLSNGTVQSRAGVVRVNKWQHVAAVVRRGENATQLYVNGYEVGVGAIDVDNLDNPNVALHIGRIPNANLFAGEIDEVRFYRRALEVAELRALVAPGSKFAKAPPREEPRNLSLQLGHRHFSTLLTQPAFMAVRLPSGPFPFTAKYDGSTILERIVLTPLQNTQGITKRFERFEQRSPRIGVHVGLRRDCGSTLTAVGRPQPVASTALTGLVFEGAINNFPSPDVEKGNVNYLAGVREIGVRSEYTDGRDMPRVLIRSIEFEGPLYDSWPPRMHQNILFDSNLKDDPPAYARQVIRSFATRAFRRPLTEAEEASLAAVFDNSFDETGDFRRSIEDALLVVLTSPQFLFLIENSSGPEAEALDPYELASKLSYFLWNSAPDKQLLDLAATATLHQSLDAEIDRMIGAPQFRMFVDEFAAQWLSLDKFDVVEVDRKRYPNLTRDTKKQLREEPVQFLRYLLQHNLPLGSLVQSDFILANEVVADYYDLADRTESGFQFVPITHNDENLGGLLSQASILAGLSDGRESNPVKRGAWLARKIIAEPPDDPPPNVPQLPEGDEAHLTLRQKLEQHRNQEGCSKCHSGIDPWGFPFEKFDAGGRFKKDPSVDASSTLPDKTEIVDLNELKDYLANDRIDQVAFSFLKHLATYAIGRSLTYNEIVFLEEQGLELKPDGYRMQDMIRFVIKSELFLKK